MNLQKILTTKAADKSTRNGADPRMSSQSTKSKGQVCCFTCGHEYSYIGTDPHDGRCPRCGSQTVSPAGELTTCSSRIVLVGDRLHIEVVATDATDRSFRYRFATNGGCATCVGAWIENIKLVESKKCPDELLTASIWRATREYGYPQCADATGSE